MSMPISATMVAASSPSTPGDRRQAGPLSGERTHGIADRGLDLGQVAVDLREPADVEAERQALVLGKLPVQRQGKLVDLAP